MLPRGRSFTREGLAAVTLIPAHAESDPALSHLEPHTTGLGPSIQPAQIPLQSLPTLRQINTPTQLGVICNLTERALDPFLQITDKDTKQSWPLY